MCKPYKEIKKALVSQVIQVLNRNKTIIIDIRKEIPLIDNPADLADILIELGWSLEDSDENGWEPDHWYYYAHSDYDFNLVMKFNGFYWDLMLYRADIDDDDDV